MKETLVLVIVNGFWMADFIETSEAARIKQLFGSTLVPMPFTAEANREDVIANTAKKNPQYKVWAVGPHYGPEKFSNRAGSFVPAPEVSR